MSYLTLNGAICLEATIRLPRRGAWIADVELAETPPVAAGDAASLILGAQTFVGTVRRVSDFSERGPDVQIVGGAGHLGTVLGPKQYDTPTGRNVVEEAFREALETLSDGSDDAALGKTLNAWKRSQRTLGRELDAVCAAIEREWRVQADGTVLIGSPSWTDATVEDYQALERDTERGLLVIASDEPTVHPGQTLEGLRISLVIHRVTSNSTRTTVYQDDGTDRTLGAFDALARGAQPVDLFGFYEYQVVSQNADQTFEMKATDTRMPDLSNVPYSPATPGETYEISSGACLVGFRGGSEQRPYVKAWTVGTPSRIAFPVTSLLHLGADPAAQFVALANLVDARLAALEAVFTAWVPVPADGGSALKVALTALSATGWPGPTVGATRVRAT